MKIIFGGHFLGLTKERKREKKHKMYVNEKELEMDQDTVKKQLGSLGSPPSIVQLSPRCSPVSLLL